MPSFDDSTRRAQTSHNTTPQAQAYTNFDQDLSNYILYLAQDRFKPNKDNGITFYYGIITNIINRDTQNCDIRDIFNLRADQIERKNPTTSKYNSSNRNNTYLVHIPSLHSILFDSEVPLNKEKKEITPEDLYKFRVEANNQQESLTIGNIVKIRFEDQLNFVNGIIEQKVENEIYQITPDPKTEQDAREIAEDYTKCVNPPTVQATGQGRAIITQIITFGNLTNTGLFDFLENFVNQAIPSAEEKFLPNGESAAYLIETSVFINEKIGVFRSTNDDFNGVKLEYSKETNFATINKCLTAPSNAITQPNVLKIEVISSNPQTKGNLQLFLISYLKSAYYVDTKADGNKITVTFKTTEETQTPEQFYNYSETRYRVIKEYNTEPQQTTETQQINNSSNEVKPAENSPCEDNTTTVESYINTDKSDWKRGSKDKALVDWFFKRTTINNNQPEIKQYEKYSISNSYNIVSFTNTPNLQNLKNTYLQNNPSFYSQVDSLTEKNGLEGENPSITFKKLENNYQLLVADLKKLRDYIAKNEGLTDQTVLILPLRWQEEKPSISSEDPNIDSNSQLCYGRAVQLVVYIKFNGVVYQIPPEILYLYVVKVLGDKQIGIGIFSDQNSYIYYENLAGLSFIDPEDNNRYWTSSPGKDELEKQLNKISAKDFTESIKTYVSAKYLSVTFNDIARKIRNLL